MPVEFDPRAADEVRAARRWYARRGAGTADRFVDELDRAVAKIGAAPQTWPAYLRGTRAVRLRRFPYLLIYIERGPHVLVLALAHVRRRPGYWARRLR